MCMNKRELRLRCAEIRKILTPEYEKTASESIEAALLQTREYIAAKTVFIYVSMPGEPETRGVIENALERGKTVLVPKCVGENMTAVEIRSLDDLRPGAYGIPEPADGEAWSGETDLAVVPCAAASRDLNRLGHGRGYYDRFLAGREIFKLCLCFDKLLCDVPAETHDIKMDMVITETAKMRRQSLRIEHICTHGVQI